MGLIEKIKQKPYKERVKATWIILAICLGVLVLLWVLTSQIGKRGPFRNGIFNSISTEVEQGQGEWEK